MYIFYIHFNFYSISLSEFWVSHERLWRESVKDQQHLSSLACFVQQMHLHNLSSRLYIEKISRGFANKVCRYMASEEILTWKTTWLSTAISRSRRKMMMGFVNRTVAAAEVWRFNCNIFCSVCWFTCYFQKGPKSKVRTWVRVNTSHLFA